MGDCLLLLYYYIAKKSSNRYKISLTDKKYLNNVFIDI